MGRKIIYTSGGHGHTADAAADGGWLTGRLLSDGIVEEFGNPDQVSQCVYDAFNAGATVVPMRPVGNQPNDEAGTSVAVSLPVFQYGFSACR